MEKKRIPQDCSLTSSSFRALVNRAAFDGSVWDAVSCVSLFPVYNKRERLLLHLEYLNTPYRRVSRVIRAELLRLTLTAARFISPLTPIFSARARAVFKRDRTVFPLAVPSHSSKAGELTAMSCEGQLSKRWMDERIGAHCASMRSRTSGD